MKIKITMHGASEWSAIDDDTYDGPSSPVGSGRTREEAVMDLLEKMQAIEE